MTVRCAAVALLAAVLAVSCASHASGPPKVEIVRVLPAGASASADRLGEYQRTLTDIVEAFEQALGLPRPDVALVLFPSRRAFEQGLVQVGYPPALARSASSFNAIGGASAILVNGGTVNRFDRRRRTRLIAHELVHSLQYRFGGGTRGASEQWLREGVAEWIACRITEHLGLGSFESLREDLLAQLGDRGVTLRPAPFDQLATFAQWVDAQGRYDAPLYTQAFIAAELLIEQHGLPAVVRYFEAFRSTTDYKRAFSDAFGIDRAAFEAAFARRWRETLVQLMATR